MSDATPKRKPGRPRLYFTDEERRNKQREWSKKWRDANPAENLASKKRYRDANPEKMAAQAARWRAANPERALEIKRRYRAAHPEAAKAEAQARRAKNPEGERERVRQWRLANPDKMAAQAKRWRAEHEDWFREQARRRRAWKRGVDAVPYNDADIFTRDGWICQLCDEPVDPQRRWPHGLAKTIDHITPMILGGADAHANVWLAHAVCNYRKHDKLVPRFAFRRQTKFL